MPVDTIKAAKIIDCWNHLTVRKNFSVKIHNISIKGIPLFEDVEIEVNSALTSICGRNGIGKTSFLRLLYRILSKDECSIGVFSPYNINDISVDIVINGNKRVFNSLQKDGLHNVEYFDSSSMALKIIDEIHSSPDKNGWFNTSEPYSFHGVNLFLTQKITGKKYEYVKVHEVEGIVEDVTFPYFEVKEINSDVIYNSESMGQGEHKLLIAIWKLIYIENNAILLIEEPESFICPASQKIFMDFLAYIIDSKKLNVIMATHSEHILSAQGLNSVLVLSRKGKKYSISKCGNNYRYFNALGLAPEKKNIFLIEDDFAKLVLEYILKSKDTYLFSTSYLHNLSGESNIKKVSEHYKDSTGLNIVAVFDADQLNDRGVSSHCVNKVFLPSTNKLSPEEEIIDCIKKNPQKYALKLDVDVELLEGEIESLICDHHDFFIELSKCLVGKHLSTLKSEAITLWIESNSEEIDKFLYCLNNINKEFTVNLLKKDRAEDYRYAETSDGGYKFKVDGNFNSYKDGNHSAVLKHSYELGELILDMVN